MEILRVIRGQEIIAPVYSLFKDTKIIGGFARWAVSPAVNPIPSGDIDLYSLNQEVYKANREILSGLGYKKPLIDRNVAATYVFDKGRLKGLPPIQLIVPMKDARTITEGPMEEIINNFDFTVVRVGIEVNMIFAQADEDFVKDEMSRTIRIKNIHCPISAVKRIAKYIKKGYYIEPIEILKLYDDWDARGPGYKQELIEGLNLLKKGATLTPEQRTRIASLLYVD